MKRFEDARWSSGPQPPAWRHDAAVELVRREPVLDVGGGDGLFLMMLRARGLERVSMVDFSDVAIERARAAGLDARVVDVTQPLPFEDNAFGTACALDVLEHLVDPRATLSELARVAEDVVVVVPNFHYWRDRIRMVLGEVPFQLRPSRGHVHWFNPGILRAMLADAGLRIDAVHHGPAARLGAVGRFLADRLPSAFAHSVAVRATSSR
jgi:SAM-dependent methyltransferase